MKIEDVKINKILALTIKMLQLNEHTNRLENLVEKLEVLVEEINTYRKIVENEKEEISKEILECGFNSIEEFKKFKGFDK